MRDGMRFMGFIKDIYLHGGHAPYTPLVLLNRQKYQKLAPEQSPGVPLCRYSLRFFNSALWASDTKNLLTLVPRPSTEIPLMGQYRENRPEGFRTSRNDGLHNMNEPHKIHSGASGPANWQGTVIKMTLNIRQHYPRHNMSLPLVLFGKGDKGKDGLGIGNYWGYRGRGPRVILITLKKEEHGHPVRI
jgi:hypothetical protein